HGGLDLTAAALFLVYYRALVNFTNSFQYGPELDDIYSPAFIEISSAVVDTLESDYNRIPGQQTVNVVLIKKIDKDVFVELDVGSDNNSNETQISDVLFSVVKDGTIASYDTSVIGFQFRRLGEVIPSARDCLSDEFRCQDGLACIPVEYVCDKRPDCSDLSDEMNCALIISFIFKGVPVRPTPPTPPKTRPPPGPGPCRADQATCQNGQCISRDYVCDGETDCTDGSDEFRTQSPCEPNEFKCQNGRCALKLWRCDGDNDCQDNSDEMNCPTKRPGDTCAPEQFVCLSDRTCIPASYQCDEEPDCADRSDEYGCAPPTVTVPPEESITAARGDTVTFTCSAIGVPVPIITWRLNWGHLPTNSRITMSNENGRGTITIRDVKEGDQGAYTCEAINAKGLVFAIPDGVLTGNCRDGHFSVGGHCMPCFCFGITKNCQSTGRYRSQITLRFTEEDDFKGVNVSLPNHLSTPPHLSNTQMLINPESEEFQLVDLSRHFLDQDTYWSLPRQFLGNKVDSYGGYLKFKVSYSLQRDGSQPKEKPDVVLSGNGQKYIYRRGDPTLPDTINHREIKFTEENWQHSSGRAVTRDDLMMTLANLESIHIRTIYDNRMASVGLSDISMDTTSKEFTLQENPRDVEECRCPAGYSGLSCESCFPGFERAPGPYLGICAGCYCNGHASACDPISGHCLSCQHNTEGPQCDKCKPGFFGDPSRGRYDDCKPCPCPYTETSRRLSDTCFLDHDNQATCDACRPGYTGRRCEKCAPGYDGNPIQPNGKCVPAASLISKCDNRGTINPISKPCYCKANVVGALCDECKNGAFNLAADNPEGCMQCFCMGVTKQCASSTWSRDQVRGGVNGQLFTLSNAANTRTISEGITQRASSEVVYRSFTSIPTDIYYWVLPQNFRGDKVTTYGGELQYSMHYEPQARSLVIDRRPDVVLQGSSIVLEHYSLTKPLPRVPATITVPFRESAWRRSDGQPCTREHLLMALADISVFMIRATYADNMAESSISNLQMDIAVPHSTGNERALEVEECACPQGYTGPSCQDCDVGYTRTPGLYLGTCEKCDCHGYASGCDLETGECLNCLHNTVGSRCENCLPGFYGNPRTGDPQACRPCPCTFTLPSSCYLDSDGQPTCECPAGYTGRRFEGSTCSTCKQGTFYLSPANKDGCLSCFCMGVTQQCSSSRHYRDVISTIFAPGNYQGFALVNRQRTNRIDSGFSVELSTDGTQLSYTNFNYLGQEPHYWQLPSAYQGDKVGAYGGKLKYTISYVPGPRGSPIEDADVQIIGNDITLVARQPWRRGHGARESQDFEIVFREEHWQRPDGMPATREHLMMVLADLDDILIRASHHSEMRSSSISGVHMDIAVPEYTGLAQALEVEQCQCPPGYHGLSCQDCSPGYTRTGGGLYLGHCELCECNGHTDSCHPETGICTNCQHNTKGELCEQCADGFFGDPTAGTPEDCQACACPGTDPDNQFSRTCESLGNGDYQCTACQPGYTGQYCEHCAPGYVGNPQARIPCLAASLVVKVYPERVQVAQGIPVTLRCQVSGYPPHYFRWSREDGRPISSTAERRRQGTELHFPSVQPSDAGIYICTCRDQRSSNRSKAEIVVTTLPSKPIEVFIEEPKRQSINVGSTVSFICTAKSKLPAYTLVWTRNGIGKLPNRAMDFNGILTIQNVQPEDAGIYVCTGSNMLGMDEGTARLHVPATEGAQPVATVNPPVLTVKQGQRAEFRCTVTGNPTPAVEWIGGPGKRIGSKAVIRNGLLTIPSVDHVDDGEYICKALNTHGEHTARGVLHVQSTSQPHGLPHVQVSPPRVEIHEGETLRLYCRAVGSPTPALTWKKRGGSLPPQARLERTDIGTLFVPNIRSSDAGTYLCVGTNTVGSSEAHIEVFVKRGEAKIIPSGVTIQPSIASVMEGETLDLNCIVPGTSPASVKWSRAGGLLSSNHQVLGTQLRILQASADDTGEYICQVEGGPFPRQASVSVSVTSSSSRKSPRLMRIVVEGSTTTLRCDPTITWSKERSSLPWRHKIVDNSLILTNVGRQDSGQYVCNHLLTDVSLVGAAPPYATSLPDDVSVRVGEVIRLQCLAHGTPPLRFEWTKVNGSLPPSAQQQGGDLQINLAKESDAGTYKCVASNKVGKSEAQARVSVRCEFIMCSCSSDSYQLGSGEAHILSREPVNDGQWHMITAVRTGKQGYLQIDGGSVQRGQSEGKSIMVNTKGNIYLGGAPDMKALTGGKYSSGITGCVKNLSLMNARPGEQPARPIDLQVHAEEGINVERCLT
uniref:Heparan sulfate proteoglycan 2 n=1 Tax=Sinocyclocheilus grahami TaxID=75366 RepID=A0A672LAK0_SINGR